jgi:hypothetical protein
VHDEFRDEGVVDEETHIESSDERREEVPSRCSFAFDRGEVAISTRKAKRMQPYWESRRSCERAAVTKVMPPIRAATSDDMFVQARVLLAADFAVGRCVRVLVGGDGEEFIF